MHDRAALSAIRNTPSVGAARVGIGGPVGSGKTALIERLIPVLTGRGVDLAVVTKLTILSPKKTPSGCAVPA